MLTFLTEALDHCGTIHGVPGRGFDVKHGKMVDVIYLRSESLRRI